MYVYNMYKYVDVHVLESINTKCALLGYGGHETVIPILFNMLPSQLLMLALVIVFTPPNIHENSYQDHQQTYNTHS